MHSAVYTASYEGQAIFHYSLSYNSGSRLAQRTTQAVAMIIHSPSYATLWYAVRFLLSDRGSHILRQVITEMLLAELYDAQLEPVHKTYIKQISRYMNASQILK